MRVAYFISSHGFGHAARACAVIEALGRQAVERGREPRFELFTSVPSWFFLDSLDGAPGQSPSFHDAPADIGLVQANALEEDLAATVAELERWIPYPAVEVEDLATRLRALAVDLVICDIAPLGLVAARRAGIPSLLVENFTWDWIYRHYGDAAPAIEPIADALADIFESADHHVQTEPSCRRSPGALAVPPVSRRPRTGREALRQRLGVPADVELVLVTMGGIEWDYSDLAGRLDKARSAWWLVIPGGVPGGEPPASRGERVLLLPHHSDFYHPDLIHAADAVIGKLGYSTLAEVYAAGIPFGYVPRPSFRESARLEAWVVEHMPHLRISPGSFLRGDWLGRIGELLAVPRRPSPGSDGAVQIARRVFEILTV